MAGITALIQAIGDENMSVQALNVCMTNISQKGNGVAKITFETDAITAGQVISDTGRRGLIIWCDKDKYIQALNDLNSGKLG